MKKLNLLIFFFGLLTAGNCFGQAVDSPFDENHWSIRRDTNPLSLIAPNHRDREFVKSFCETLKDRIYFQDEGLLFQSKQYLSSESASYNLITVCRNGTVYKLRITPIALQDNSELKLNYTQLTEIKQRLESLKAEPLSLAGLNIENERFNSLVFLSGDKYSQLTYHLPVPDEVQKVTNFIWDLIWQKAHPDSTKSR